MLRACAGKVKGVGVYWLVTGLYGGYEEEMEKGKHGKASLFRAQGVYQLL